MISRRNLLQSAALACFASPTRFARAANAPGVTDTEIKIGQTMPYSGPASSYGLIGRTEAAYFRMINEQGGINGRKIDFISLDDAYSAPKTVEQTRRLVEQEGVAFIFGSLGTPTVAVRPYLNDNKIPDLFLAGAADGLTEPKHFPWTLGLNPGIAAEGRIYARHILATHPNARIGVLYQNDVLGKTLLSGLQEGVGGDKASMIVATSSYEATDPTVDSQVIKLQASGADTLILAATAKAAAQAIRKAYDIGWSPDRFLFNGASAIEATLKPAGLEKSKGVMSAQYGKDPHDPRWKDDPGIKQVQEFAAKYLNGDDLKNVLVLYGYNAAALMVQVLNQCGDDLSRENIMRQALNIKGFLGPFALPGATIDTSPTNYFPMRKFQLARFNGENWELFGDLLTD